MTSLPNAVAMGPHKLSKPRSRALVKPILKKGSHSEKNSLDLDRWEEQIHYSSHGWGGSTTAKPANHGDAVSGAGYGGAGAGGGVYASSSSLSGAGRTARDVSFSLSAADLHNGPAGPANRKFTHARSISGASHISVATTSSGHHGHGTRSGTFVHPFQQTPRTCTPPLSYANSLVSLDNTNNPRDYSPAITEDDDDLDSQSQFRHYQSSSTNPLNFPTGARRPSLVSQRSDSLSDIAAPPPLRINTSGRSSGPPTTRVGGTLTKSRSDLHLSTLSSSLDSPTSTIATANGQSSSTTAFVGPSLTSPSLLASPTSSVAPPMMSPLRSSLEMGFRLRSRSELDPLSQREQVREARRKFEEKERAKQEKYAREAVKKRDRADNRETPGFERIQAQLRKASSGLGSGRNSISTDAIRPSASRKSTNMTDGYVADPEKVAFSSNSYDNVAQGQTPTANAADARFEVPRRTLTVKRKTASAWTSFILWLRTRFIKLSRR